ncbi:MULTISPECIES: carbonic anhydrase [unclassified Nitratiruptor]|uniref:carbonic anhydrase n=1 Tax=unclassified Nitratiruptor TaxID=2624044 RepID=UPI001915B597|nr:MULTISPECIES: carbonic anhydrase family protein [unclassified Nitratiruptor]BCD59699.1 carbonic anhydrase [Nitratiruptor sp. YY08-10]BCD63623.1 carbonic anhydrase [Nitratiruptor sp. YY08-14]
MKKLVIVTALCAWVFAGVTGEGHHANHWSYSGQEGPQHWGEIDPKFRMCALGVNQSPIDMNRFVDAKLPSLKITYAGIAKEVVYNGHTIKVTTLGKNEVVIDGKPFVLQQFHFHTPSENKINGKQFPMEAHFVHKSKDGEYLVIALMFKEGAKNSALQKILNDLQPEVGQKRMLKEMFNPGDFFPRKLDYYRYDGSFTTPPCTEGVRWIVLKRPVQASKEQIAKMHEIMHNNNRPVQPLKARVILK